MLGEFLSANVSMPFLLFMVKGITSSDMTSCDTSEGLGCSLFVPGFNEFQEESEIAFYTGVLGLSARAFVLGLHSSRSFSGCIFSHSISHFSTMGVYQPFFNTPLWFA